MSEQPVSPVQILLVEDSQADVEFTREVLKETKLVNELSVVGDGEKAMRYVRQEAEFADRVRPDLILLDLNLPRKDGREVLEEIKQDPTLRRIPVIVLTTSSEERDVLSSYDAYVNAYVTKPLGLDAFVKVVQSIDDFWFSIVRLPRS